MQVVIARAELDGPIEVGDGLGQLAFILARGSAIVPAQREAIVDLDGLGVISDGAVEILAQSAPARSTAEAVTLVRVELAPGAATPEILTADGNRVLYVEEGTITFRVASGKVSLSDPSSGSSKGKPIKVNTWVEVTAGQSLIISKGAKYEYRNDGDVVAIILASGGSDVVAEGCGGGCS